MVSQGHPERRVIRGRKASRETGVNKGRKEPWAYRDLRDNQVWLTVQWRVTLIQLH